MRGSQLVLRKHQQRDGCEYVNKGFTAISALQREIKGCTGLYLNEKVPRIAKKKKALHNVAYRFRTCEYDCRFAGSASGISNDVIHSSSVVLQQALPVVAFYEW